DMGVDLRLNSPVESMQSLLDEGFDAVFVGSGAPKGKELDIPGRQEADANIHIGIEWLEAVAFGHTEAIGRKVLIIGVGNTAMDCCRTSLRLGADDVRVMARKPRDFFKASDWELEDAEEEQVEIVINRSPKKFVVEEGKLTGMVFEVMEYAIENGRITDTRVTGEEFLAADDVILAIGQETAFPWIERDIGIEFNQWDEPVCDRTTHQSTRPGVFFGGDAAFGPENIIWAVEHGHQAAISIHNYCNGKQVEDRLPQTMNLGSRKMGIHEWSYSNYFEPIARRKMEHVPLTERFRELDTEVELGFTAEQTACEVERCLNCDIQTVFTDSLCIECDACIDICPTQCLTITENGREEDVGARLTAAPKNPDQPMYISDQLEQTGRIMVKDENVCVHCGLCAERCPTAAWDMQKSMLGIPYAKDHDVMPIAKVGS
ncbi:MAG: FAD-dependent oxidoreductase, partial [Wenzhouxiangellaceae bacterium]|nr:FAD-dependent oxidoreductase [Wenzhouxiangellaceae bacterium]